MAAERHPYRGRAGPTPFVAGLAVLQSEPVAWNTIRCVQRLAFEGSLVTLGGNTRVRVYIDRHGYNHYLAEQAAPAANTLYWMTDDIFLIPGERLCVEWDQAQAGTVLEMFMIGYWHDIDPGILT